MRLIDLDKFKIEDYSSDLVATQVVDAIPMEFMDNWLVEHEAWEFRDTWLNMVNDWRDIECDL